MIFWRSINFGKYFNFSSQVCFFPVFDLFAQTVSFIDVEEGFKLLGKFFNFVIKVFNFAVKMYLSTKTLFFTTIYVFWNTENSIKNNRFLKRFAQMVKNSFTIFLNKFWALFEQKN